VCMLVCMYLGYNVSGPMLKDTNNMKMSPVSRHLKLLLFFPGAVLLHSSEKIKNQ
jgi:hypothetical protein